jgi:hypothetical protein
LHGLGCLGQGHGLPPGYREEMVVELGAGVCRVHDLCRGAPALGGALLEQAEAVGVVGVAEVGQVDQGCLDRGGDRDDPAAWGHSQSGAHLDDGGGVADGLAVRGDGALATRLVPAP